MSKKKKDNLKEIQSEEIYKNLLEMLIQGDRKNLNSKNKKLLKDFEKEVDTYAKRVYFLHYIKDLYFEWNTINSDINSNFNQLIYLLNLYKEDLHKQFLMPYSIDPKYLKTDKTKININKDENPMKNYLDLEKKVGIV